MTSEPAPGSAIRGLLREDWILPALRARDRDGALREIAEFFEGKPEAAGTGLFDKLLQREKLGSTAVGEGFAIPHCKIPDLGEPLVGLAVSRSGVPFEALDGKPTHVFFVVLGTDERPEANLRVLASVALLMRSAPRIVPEVVRSAAPGEILAVLAAAEGTRP